LLLVTAVSGLVLPSIAFANPAPPFNSVTFLQNDSPTDLTAAGQQDNVPASLTLFTSLNPSFANPGYTFDDWNTTPSITVGSTVYSNGSIFDFSGSLTLYAQWTPNVYTVSYIPDGGVAFPESSNFVVGSSPLSLPAPTFAGYVFDGWNTASNGGGTTLLSGANYSPTSSVSLYAQWSLALNDTINFAANGANGSIASVTDFGGTSIILPNATSLSYPGYSFIGWNSSAIGDGTSYLSAAPLILNSSLTLYAQWAKNPAVTIDFSANGGVGSVSALSGAEGTSVTLPGGTGLSYDGHTFASWNTAADGSGTVFNVATPLQFGNSLTLFAQWDALLVSKSSNVLIGAVGSFARNSSHLTANLKTQVRRLAQLTKSSHFTAETLYGYTNNTGSLSAQLAISRQRANAVASYLRTELASMHVTRVKVTAAGEGTFRTETAASFRRVEVFVKG
jgi:uncharacterized repeat protein (TIGR02543 family)